jgi:hypothetical protein
VIHVYGVAGAPVTVPPAPGVDGAVPRGFGVHPLVAIVSDHAEDPRPTAARLLEHERVLEGLLPYGVVPARYGPAVPDAGVLSALLTERVEQLSRLLERLRGRVEMGVHMDLPAKPTRPSPTGRSYLLDKLHRERLAQRMADRLDHHLGALAVRRNVLASRDDLRIAYLVDAEQVADFRARLDPGPDWAAALVCTGPWPAYSFVSEEQP